MKIIVIGGGIVGLGSAWLLSQAGHEVVVLEQHYIGAGASGGAIGALVPYPPYRNHEKLPQIQRQSIGDWPELAAAIELASDLPAGFRPIDRWQIFKTAEQFEQGQAVEQKTNGLWQVFAPQAAAKHTVGLEFGAFGAALCRDTGCVDVPQFLKALTAAARRAGVQILSGITVEEVKSTEGGVELQTNHGKVNATHCIVAAGAWSFKLMPQEAPTKPVLGQALKLSFPGHGLKQMVRRGRAYLIPHDDEIYVGSTLNPAAGFARLPTADGVEELLAEAYTLMPVLKDAELLATWTGLRPKSDEGEPIIRWSTAHPNVAVATGHYGIGYGLLPWTLRRVQQLFS